MLDDSETALQTRKIKKTKVHRPHVNNREWADNNCNGLHYRLDAISKIYKNAATFKMITEESVGVGKVADFIE